MERQLVQHLKFLESRLFGLTRASVQELAFQLAEKNGFAHRFNPQKQKAGQEWMEGFLRRNKDISLRKPEATSAARAQAFNRPQVQKFFQLYGELLNSVDFRPHRIYNADESGLSTVQKPQKILATAGRKQVGIITSAERGINTTVVCCVNAVGTFVPPMIIFPRKNMKNELVDEAPPGTLGVAQQSGWMTTEIFLKWMKHFQSFVKASIDDKVILIVDGHASHKGIETLEYAKQNGICVICLPPHCTHRIQPLDVSFFAPLKTYFNQEISKWLKAHPGRVVTQFQIAGLFNEAYGKAATVQNGCHGFKSAGIWPLNPEIFPDYMYEPAETTNIPLGDISNERSQQLTTPGDISIAGPSTQQQDDSFLVPVTNVLQVAATTQPQFQLQTSHAVTTNENNAAEIAALTKQQADNSSQVPAANTDQEVVSTPLSNKKHQSAAYKEHPSTSILSVPIEEISPAPKGRFISGQGKSKNERCSNCSQWAHASCADVVKRTKHFICELCK